MVSFDAQFRFRADDELLVRELFAAARRRCRALHVRWTSKIVAGDPGYAYVVLDGGSGPVDLVLERLRRDLPTFAEGVAMPARTPAQRRLVANGLVDVLGRYRNLFYDRYPEGYIPRLRGVRQPADYAMYDLFPRNHPELWGRLGVTIYVLSAWPLKEIPAEVALEELHTAFELLMTAGIGKRRAPAFTELVSEASRRGWLGSLYADPRIAVVMWDDPSDALTEEALLISLKDHRKSAKHHGATDAEAWLTSHFWPATALLETLACNIP